MVVCKYVQRLEEIRDRAILYTRDGVYQVLGGLHPPGQLIVIPRYKYTCSPTPWFSRVYRLWLKRLTKHHRPEEISRLSTTYEPMFSHSVSVLSIQDVTVCDPVERINEVYSHPHDELEETLLALIEELRTVGFKDLIGVTGSILGYYHNTRVSDIDIVVYLHPRQDCIDVIETLSTILTSLPKLEVDTWVRQRRVDTRLYRAWLHGMFRRKRISVCFGWLTFSKYASLIVKSINGVVEREVVIEPSYLCRALLWPHIGFTRSGEVIISYDGCFAPALLEGGRWLLRGLKAKVIIGGEELDAYLIGVSETTTWLRTIT